VSLERVKKVGMHLDLKKLAQMMYYLQIAFVVSGLYLLFVYIVTDNLERIQMLTFVLSVNLISLKVTRDRFKA
jgi:presenilin-like A22 family membrane protease